MYGLKMIIKKELTRVFKDKKLVFSMFILPIILVVGIMLLMTMLINNLEKDKNKHISSVYVQNATNDFKTILDGTENIEVKYIDTDNDAQAVKDDIYSGDVDLLIVFPEDFESKISDEKGLSNINTFYNPTEDNSTEARVRVVDGCLELYRNMLVEKRFGDASSVIVFTVDQNNDEAMLSDDSKASAKMLGMFVPYFVTMLIFAGAMSIGIDCIAGEKERGTLASLLITPVKRAHIVLGKVGAISILSLLSSIVYIVGMLVAMPLAFKYGASEINLGDLSFDVNAVQVIQIVVLIFGVVFLYVGIISLVSVMAKTTKEAQSYIAPVYLVVIVAGMISMYTSDVKSDSSYLMPLFNSSIALKGIFTKEITNVQFFETVVVTYGVAALVIALITKAFKSEKIIFNA